MYAADAAAQGLGKQVRNAIAFDFRLNCYGRDSLRICFLHLDVK